MFYFTAVALCKVMIRDSDDDDDDDSIGYFLDDVKRQRERR
jgi:hypothetical protein